MVLWYSICPTATVRVRVCLCLSVCVRACVCCGGSGYEGKTLSDRYWWRFNSMFTYEEVIKNCNKLPRQTGLFSGLGCVVQEQLRRLC